MKNKLTVYVRTLLLLFLGACSIAVYDWDKEAKRCRDVVTGKFVSTEHCPR